MMIIDCAGFKRIFNYLGPYPSQSSYSRRPSYQLSAYKLREPSAEQSDIVDALLNDPQKCLQIDSVAVYAKFWSNVGLPLLNIYTFQFTSLG